MTTVSDARGTSGRQDDGGLDADLGQLRAALADHPFPARQDDLIAACLARHEPARVMCRLAGISRERLYACLDEVLDDVVALARG